MKDVISESCFYRLFDAAEAVRWQMASIQWQSIDADKVTPAQIQLVREIAFSELTTMTATRRFLTSYADDSDFSQWLSVWFYEETKHPQVLLRWLHEVGEVVDESFMLRGRASAPFMKSKMGMLVTNIISEMVASSSYTLLSEHLLEPVLSSITAKLAADEARHAASFYEYARRHLDRCSDKLSERRDAVKVLYMWLQDNGQVSHPVNAFYSRNQVAMLELKLPQSMPRERIIAVIGGLVDLPLTMESDLLAQIRDLGPQSGQINEHTTRGQKS